MANEFHIRVIKLAKYEELRPAAYGVFTVSQDQKENLKGWKSSTLYYPP